MFIRKRTRYSKQKGYETESYQVVESYRENGKVKQRVIYNLGSNPTPEDLLPEAKNKLKYALGNDGVVNNFYLYEPGWRIKGKTSIEILEYHIEMLEYIIKKLRSVKGRIGGL